MANEIKNIILIISDTLRRDFLSVYGNKWIHTEHIQKFAEKSLVFDRAYSASFPTVPCRRDIFTGCYTATYTPWAPMTEYELVLQSMLQQRGFTSYMITDEPHIVENGYYFDKGFTGFEWIRGQEGDRWKTSPNSPDFRCNPAKIRNPDRLQKCHMRVRSEWRYESDTFPGRTGTAAMKWLDQNYNRGPFYLYVDFFDPHEPWDAPQWYIDMYDPNYTGEIVDYPRYDKWQEFLSPEELKHCRALYAAEVTLIDRWVGRIFEKIEDLGLLEHTLVIFSTDHGFLLGEHGFIGKSFIKKRTENTESLAYLPLFEEINHIPLIVHTPGGKTGRTEAIVQPPDFFPTILDSIGSPSLACHGFSFKEVLIGKKSTHREFALSFPFLHGQGVPISFVKDNFAAIFFSKNQSKSDQGMLKQDKAVDGEFKSRETWEEAQDMLFDLKADPAQEHNVASQNPEKMKEFREILLEFLDDLDTDDDIIQLWR